MLRLEDPVAGRDRLFPVRRLAADGVEAWRQVLDVAMEWKREWWLEHALAWLPHFGPTPEDVAVLSGVVRDKRYSQRLRQASWRLLPHHERRRHAED